MLSISAVTEQTIIIRMPEFDVKIDKVRPFQVHMVETATAGHVMTDRRGIRMDGIAENGYIQEHVYISTLIQQMHRSLINNNKVKD